MMTNADPTPAKALILAMSRFDQPLPHSIQTAVNHLSITLRDNRSSINDEIRQLVAQDPHLHQLYTAAYDELESQYQNQERSKSLDAVFPRETELWDKFVQIASANDSVLAARQTLQSIATAQHKPRTRRLSWDEFWDRSGRAILFAYSGGFVGAIIGQLPGAILGAILTAILGWFIIPDTAKSSRKPE